MNLIYFSKSLCINHIECKLLLTLADIGYNVVPHLSIVKAQHVAVMSKPKHFTELAQVFKTMYFKLRISSNLNVIFKT